jgi:hypothetical protein
MEGIVAVGGANPNARVGYKLIGLPTYCKVFHDYFSTTARWEGDQLVEEYVFWDSALMAQQIGLA